MPGDREWLCSYCSWTKENGYKPIWHNLTMPGTYRLFDMMDSDIKRLFFVAKRTFTRFDLHINMEGLWLMSYFRPGDTRSARSGQVSGRSFDELLSRLLAMAGWTESKLRLEIDLAGENG